MTGVYFTITGMNHYQGSDFLKRGMEVELIKEPENHYDMFAIRVEVYGRGKIGYVANNPNTVLEDTMEAGEIYNMMRSCAKAKVRRIDGKGVICELSEVHQQQMCVTCMKSIDVDAFRCPYCKGIQPQLDYDDYIEPICFKPVKIKKVKSKPLFSTAEIITATSKQDDPGYLAFLFSRLL